MVERSDYDTPEEYHDAVNAAAKRQRRKVQAYSVLGGSGAVLLVLLFWSITIIPEGHIGVVKKFSKADHQIGPGFHMIVPIMNTVEEIEVRQKKSVEELAAATQNQLPVAAVVSINWTVDSTAGMDLFIQYGGLAQFEDRILDPRLRQAAKAAISQFPADQLIRDRQAAVAKILEFMVEAMEPYPVTVNSPQIENFKLPKQYMDAVLAKEQAREDAEREKHALERQRLEALREVNSADAAKQSKILVAQGNADAIRLEAEANAYSIRELGAAEAAKIRLINEVIAKNPDYVEYVRAQQWNGVYPTTMMGGDTSVLWNLGSGAPK